MPKNLANQYIEERDFSQSKNVYTKMRKEKPNSKKRLKPARRGRTGRKD